MNESHWRSGGSWEKYVQIRKGGKERMWVMGKEMNNHQYSPDKVQVILDVSLGADGRLMEG